jgi:hypothetical protein
MTLSGCPTAPPSGDEAQAGAQPGADMSPDAFLAEAAAGTEPTPPAGASEGALQEPGKATFDRFITPGADVVTIHVVVTGIEVGQIDFTAFEGDTPTGSAEVVHAQSFKGGKVDVTAPAGYPRKLIVSATSFDSEGRLSPDGATAALRDMKALVIGTEDQTITLVKNNPDVAQPARGPAVVQPPVPTGNPPTSADTPPAEGAPAAP